ncbi:MAG TPA: hypothetical protein DFK21_02020 [Salmonella bongori]|nr:hypothetical protein [Salmonella bongori]ECG8257596.1 hypothetical protein [Salmonella bongori serovar 48:i:-]TNB53414.1 hypothetical protein FGW25_04170 [Salmonella bongori serovar 48:z35:-]ECC9751244.1 hypothetical protein [Salmonella bongori]ECE6545734.1 hypothetical protein [Salmonella bongori]
MITAKRRMPNPLASERRCVDDDATDLRYSSIISNNNAVALACILSGLVLVMPFFLLWATLIV